MAGSKDIKDSLSELADNLGTVGLFMLGEVRSFLKKSWGASKDEFIDAVDQVTKSMKQSGKLALDDIDRAADRLKADWDKLYGVSGLEWDTFFNEMKNRLDKMGDITEETFDLAVEQAKKALDAHWSAVGRVGEDQLRTFQKYSEEIAKAVRGQWSTFWDQMEKTGKKVDRAMQAARDELKKEE
jgi:hypothetical protein